MTGAVRKAPPIWWHLSAFADTLEQVVCRGSFAVSKAGWLAVRDCPGAHKFLYLLLSISPLLLGSLGVGSLGGLGLELNPHFLPRLPDCLSHHSCLILGALHLHSWAPPAFSASSTNLSAWYHRERPEGSVSGKHYQKH